MSPFATLEQDSAGFMRSCAVAAMAELDVPTVLLEHGNSLGVQELATLCHCERRSLEYLLDALAALGYLKKIKGFGQASYAVSSDYQKLLDSREQTSYMPMLRHRACMLRSWARLSFAVKEGRPQKDADRSFLGEDKDKVSFISAMDAIGQRLVTKTMEQLEQAGLFRELPAKLRLLDIGGASGTYTLAFLQRLPESFAWIFDLAEGLKQAKKRFGDSEYAKRVTLVEGDFFKVALPKGFDFAWLSAIIHQLSREESRALYAKIADALLPKGILAIRDFVMDELRLNPLDGTLFGLNMLVATAGGRVYTFEEIAEDLNAAGFTDAKLLIDDQSMSSVVTARKIA